MTPRPLTRAAAPLIVGLHLGVLLGCSDLSAPAESKPIEPTPPVLEAGLEAVPDAGDEAFVRRLIPVLWGRQPSSLSEVAVLTEALQSLSRAELVAALVRSDEYRAHWAPLIRDFIAVERIGARANEACYALVTGAGDSEALARSVRDGDPASPAEVTGWTLADLVDSALRLDDLSPVWRTHAFANLHLDYDLPDLDGARAARDTRVDVFLRSHLGRRLGCLDCHNSEYSVTDDPDPQVDRFWPVPGTFEREVLGAITAVGRETLRGLFRRRGVVAGVRYENEPQDDAEIEAELAQAIHAFGMSDVCGTFVPRSQVPTDDLDGDAFFAGPLGDAPSVWDLEARLQAGLTALDGDPQARTSAPETALAWLVSAAFVDHVVAEVSGARLTVEHAFPRHRAQRDALQSFAETFVGQSYSLRALLTALVTSPWFNAPLPATGADTPEPFGPLFDPWLDDVLPNEERRNGLGQLVRRRSGRVVLRSVRTALELTEQREFPLFDQAPEAQAYADVGVYLKEGNPGFRDVSFQSLLAWEHTFGACQDLADLDQCPLSLYLDGGSGREEARCLICSAHADACGWDARCCDVPWDSMCPAECLELSDESFGLTDVPPYPPAASTTFIDRVVQAAGQTPEATLGDAVAALKDRLLADPTLEPDEAALLAAVAGTSLETPFTPSLEPALRAVCGVFVASPDFLLAGHPGPTRVGSAAPGVLVPGQEAAAACERLAPLFTETSGDTVTCTGGHLTGL